MLQYLVYWGMEINPFEKDIKPSKLTVSNDFKSATGCVKYLFDNGGVGVITGRSGYGKTTVVRAVVDEYAPGLIRPYYITLSTIKVLEFYKQLAQKLGLDPMRTKTENFNNIQSKIKSMKNEERIRPVIILDEAQYLCKEILTDLPILMNFEMDSKNYAALLLIGMPNLINKLNMEQHECLRDRIICHYEITGMSLDEVHKFIEDRMSEAGVTRNIFEENAIIAAHSSSKNSIRRLNQILNKSLMIGCSSGAKTVNADFVQSAVDEINLGNG